MTTSCLGLGHEFWEMLLLFFTHYGWPGLGMNLMFLDLGSWMVILRNTQIEF